MDAFTVRRATADDAGTLTDLRIHFANELDVLEVPEKDVRAEIRDYMERSLADGSFVAWVAEAGGGIVGTGGMVPYERMIARGGVGREAYVMNVHTIPEWRKRGVGTAIMEAIVAYASDQGIKLCLVATEHGRSLYPKLGFRHDDRYFRWG